jgi:hypothetical protein
MIRNLVLLLTILLPSLASSADNDLASVKRYDRAIMIVLPEASGSAVPLATKPEDCGDTQWLTRDGRRMAEDIGDALRDAGFGEASVYSSQSCAAIETVNVLKLRHKGTLPFLNDIADSKVSRKQQRQALALFLADHVGKRTMVLISHHNNVIDISGSYPSFGAAIALTVNVTRFEPVFLRHIQIR